MNSNKDKPFFVGYLNMPAELSRFYKPLIVILIGFSAMAGFAIASLQKTTGPAEWKTDATITVSGLLMMDPYPVVHWIDPENPDKTESALLVRQGKLSADTLALDFSEKPVTVTGYPIRRGTWTMLELASDDAIDVDSSASQDELSKLRQRTQTVSLGEVSLAGEVVDSKCFLGVMKPGEGRIHKACAELCMLGGIPAMLLARDENQQKYGYMLTQSDGGSASGQLASYAADAVQVSGELQQKGGLLYIRVSRLDKRSPQTKS